MNGLFIENVFLDFKIVVIFVLSEGVLAFDEEQIGLFIIFGIVGLFCYVVLLGVGLVQVLHWFFREGVLILCYKNSNIRAIWRSRCALDHKAPQIDFYAVPYPSPYAASSIFINTYHPHTFTLHYSFYLTL